MFGAADLHNGVYAVGAAALYGGIRFLWWGIDASREQSTVANADAPVSPELDRLKRADAERERRSPAARYVISAVCFAAAAGVVSHLLTPAIAYVFILAALAARSIADQIAEERAPRRRSALLLRSRRVDPILMIWIGLAALSSLVLLPGILSEANRATAILVALCVVGMIFVAGRIATAPPLLAGEDLEAEEIVDRETRTIRTGNICVLSVGAVMAFIFFIDPAALPSIIYPVSMVAWIGLVVWKALYARHLSRTSLVS